MRRSPIVGGRYELMELLGEGGNGRVYRAVQRPLGREVAVKVLRSDAGPAEAQRFAREISLVQRLEHPNTVRLYDFGTDEHGRPFIVFELLRGPTLEAACASGPMAPARVARIAVQVLKSLMEAHARGIVHRDIKPANVLLVDYSGERDFVKVLDFGVARVADTPGDKSITRQGQIVGTPAYMAPEQVREGPLSPRTDLYAVGLLMAEALAGRPVFAGSDGAVWIAQASDAPVPLPPLVSGSILGAIVEKATRKDPRARYASAEEMIADIERATLDDAVAATRPTMPDVVPEPLPTGRPVAIDVPLPALPMNPTLVAAKHLSMGAFLAMVVLMIALIGVQVRAVSTRVAPPPAAAAVVAAPIVHPERLAAAGWHVATSEDVGTAGGTRTTHWSVWDPGRRQDGHLYVTTFADETQARSFASGTRAVSRDVAVEQRGTQVVRVDMRDRATSERLMALVL